MTIGRMIVNCKLNNSLATKGCKNFFYI
jgi:hypothetical protein